MSLRVVFVASLLAGSLAGAVAGQPATPESPSPTAATPEAQVAALLDGAGERRLAGDVEAARKLTEAALVLAPAESETRKNAERLRGQISVAGLDQARTDLEAARYRQAESRLRQALLDIPAGSPDREKTERLLDLVLTVRRQAAQLDEVERLLAERDYVAASASLAKLVPEAKDGRILERANGLWARSHPGWWPGLLGRFRRWFYEQLPLLAAIALLILVLWLRREWHRRQEDRWLLAEVVDSSSAGMGRLIASYFSFWATQESSTVTSGLLLLDASRIPLAPEFEVLEQVDLPKELESVPLTVGSLNLGAAAKLVSVFGRWFSRGRPEIQGIAYWADDKTLIARLTARYCKWGSRLWGLKLQPVDRAITVTASAEKSAPDAARAVAEEVTFKMLYAIAKKEQPWTGERANELRRGLDKLRAYISGKQSPEGRKPREILEEAGEIFEGVRKTWPDSLEAHLYEGIALDLLERHEEAIEHFRHVKEKARDKNEEMYLRAGYNEAIAHLRNLYQLEGIDRCINLVNALVDGYAVEDLRTSPIKALALAVKADAFASRVIHWDQIPHQEIAKEGDPVPLDPETKLERVIESCVAKVLGITNELEPLLADAGAGGPKWDADALRQLEWAIHNAKGDVYLSSATAAARQNPEAEPRRYEDYLDMALSAYRKCEMLLPAGVETLSNLGTLFLFRGKPGDLVEARRYLKRVTDLNPNYEYAYYRLAQSWEKEHWREKVIEILRSFGRPVGIPEFRKMYEHYYVQPVEA